MARAKPITRPDPEAQEGSEVAQETSVPRQPTVTELPSGNTRTDY